MKTQHTQGKWKVKTSDGYVDPYSIGDSILIKTFTITRPFSDKKTAKYNYTKSLQDRGLIVGDESGNRLLIVEFP